MARGPLSAFDGRDFDVAVIGAGVNGCSAAQHLAAAGYTVLLIEQRDFASGASSRSSRMLSGGIRYLAPGTTIWEFVRHPGQLLTALGMAKAAMATRSQFVNTTPERVENLTFSFPVYRGDPYRPWQARLAFKVLEMLGPGDLPLGFKLLAPAEAIELPLLEWLRDPDRLLAAGRYHEYQFRWPERVAMDTVLDAERMGAAVRNYTAVTGMAREGDGRWRLELTDGLEAGQTASVRARMVLNTAGVWIDRVNALSGRKVGRRILGTKGIHLAVRLPPRCKDQGVMGLNREGEHLYCFPWRDLHYFGPTETVYDGDIDDVHPTDDEIDWLVDEVNYIMPSLGFRRQDVLFAWAGVRPLTYDPKQPKGARRRQIHDLAREGMPGVLALTAGPIMTHRSAGTELTRAVAKRIEPSGEPRTISYAPQRFAENRNSPPLLDHFTEVKLSDLRHAVEHEYPADLIDLLFRRVGAGWTETMAHEAARRAAEEVADLMGWDQARVACEVAKYHAHLAHHHRVGPDGLYGGDRRILGGA